MTEPGSAAKTSPLLRYLLERQQQSPDSLPSALRQTLIGQAQKLLANDWHPEQRLSRYLLGSDAISLLEPQSHEQWAAYGRRLEAVADQVAQSREQDVYQTLVKMERSHDANQRYRLLCASILKAQTHSDATMTHPYDLAAPMPSLRLREDRADVLNEPNEHDPSSARSLLGLSASADRDLGLYLVPDVL